MWKLAALWPLSGLAAWIFGVWWNQIDLTERFDSTYWFVAFPCAVAGPLSWIPVFIH